MKIIATALILTAAVVFASPAFADSARLVRLLNATQSDFEMSKASFREACIKGERGYRDYQEKAQAVAFRIAARRAAIASIAKTDTKTMKPGQRGLYKMVTRDLDQINLRLLALIKDEKGYSGFIRATKKEDMVRGISDWQEGIRQAIAMNRRCIKMMGRVDGQYLANAGTGPVVR